MATMINKKTINNVNSSTFLEESAKIDDATQKKKKVFLRLQKLQPDREKFFKVISNQFPG